MKHGSFAAWLWGMSLLLGFFLSVVSVCALDEGWYHKWYAADHLAQKLQVPEDSLDEALDMMTGYVKGTRSDLDGSLEGIGEVYNAKEKAHMKDVKALYDHARMVMWVCWGIAAGLGLWLVWKRQFVLMAQGFVSALAAYVIVFGFLGMWAATGFDDFWTHFHQLFFSNDLWLLDPATDFMIRICPAQMFFDLVARILLWFVSALTAGGLVSYWILKRQPH